jgi:hypothetical protein
MKTIKLRLLAVLSFFIFHTLSAQENEVWKLNGSSEVISTIETEEGEGFPEINLNFTHPDEVGPSSPEEILLKAYKMYNNGNFNIAYSAGEGYSKLITASSNYTTIHNFLQIKLNAHVDGFISIGENTVPVTDKLHVEGSSMFNGSTKIYGNNSLEFGYGLGKEFNAGKLGYQLFTPNNSLDIVGAGTTAGDRSIKLWDKVYTPKMIIGDGAENTGTHANAELHVNGTIVSGRVVATIDNWADYVFTSDYKLKSLNEVEEYIEQNGHLPNIPNSETVANDGVDLADMNRLLLEKVEELTLYVIDLQSQINDIDAQKTK